MCAKPAKKSARKAPDPAAPLSVTASTSAPAATTVPDASHSWLDSSDPRRRRLGRVLLAGIWLYLAALWLLALDQWFHWGIFGPAVPRVS